MKYLLCFFILFLALPLSAEEKKEAMDLDEIVVTATRTQKEVSQTPASTSVVTGKDMEQRTILAPDQAVNTLPGVLYMTGTGN